MFSQLFFENPRPWPCAACCEAAPDLSDRRCPERCNAFLIEWRDEVYARLAADLKKRGLRVIRSRAAAMAPWRFGQCRWNLILVNLCDPEHEAWSMVEQCRLVRPTARIWVYSHRFLPNDAVIAEYAGADAMIEYRGDLFRLSNAICGRLASLPARLPTRESAREHPHVHTVGLEATKPYIVQSGIKSKLGSG